MAELLVDISTDSTDTEPVTDDFDYAMAIRRAVWSLSVPLGILQNNLHFKVAAEAALTNVFYEHLTGLTALERLEYCSVQGSDIFGSEAFSSYSVCSHVEGRRNFFCSWEWRSRPTVFQIFLIYIKLTTLTTFLSKLVQFICYHSVITNNIAMPKENSEFVTLPILKEMLAAQERAYKTTTQLLVDNMRSEIRSLRSEVDELKESVKFTSAKYEELKEKSQKVESKLEVDMRAVYRQIEGLSENLRQGLEVIEDKNEYLENQSRRNNIRILGVEETEDEKSWMTPKKL